MPESETSQVRRLNRLIRTTVSVAIGILLAVLLQKMVWYYHIFPRYPILPSLFFFVAFMVLYFYIDRRIMQGTHSDEA